MAGAVGQRVSSWLDELSEDVVGWTFPPVHRALEGSRWTPDKADGGGYCRRCGDSVGPGEATHQGCSTCREGGELSGGIGDEFIRLGAYVDPLRGWVRAVKYQGWNEMGVALGRMLGEQLQRAAGVDSSSVLVVPMPMPWMRRVYRGTDHARDLAAGMSTVMRSPIESILVRGNGPTQVSLPPSERRRAGARRLRVRRRLGGWPLADLDLVLVDDVRTTGASLRAAVRLLRALKPRRIICAAVAVSDSSARKARAQHARHEEAPGMGDH